MASLKLLAAKSIECRIIEAKHRLAELKQVLIYPENTQPVNEHIEKLLNDLPQEKPMPRKLLKGKQGVKALVAVEDLQKEQAKSEKILD